MNWSESPDDMWGFNVLYIIQTPVPVEFEKLTVKINEMETEIQNLKKANEELKEAIEFKECKH